MNEIRLKAFLSVAKNLSFTKASRELCISQPAISKHINALEDRFNVKLFLRIANNIVLTEAGEVMLYHVNKILSNLNDLEYAMHLLNKDHVGKIRIGASTTIAQYILPSILAKFIEEYPNIDISIITENSSFIENALTQNDIDLGLVEGLCNNSSLSFKPFMKDELVATVGFHNQIIKDKEISIKKFYEMPLVLRERGSGTLNVIEQVLLENNVKISDLNVKLYLGSTEAIKTFIQNSQCLAIVSINAIEKELENKLLKIVDIGDISFNRVFYYVTNYGGQNPLVNHFLSFLIDSLQKK